nr:unnamed protein product [Spirometra erinaceieuropaei]
MEQLSRSLDEDPGFDVVYMDFNEAFGSIPNRCFLYKVREFGDIPANTSLDLPRVAAVAGGGCDEARRGCLTWLRRERKFWTNVLDCEGGVSKTQINNGRIRYERAFSRR